MKRNSFPRLFIGLLALCFAVSLSACATSETQTSSQAQPGSPDIDAAGSIFTQMPLDGHPLEPLGEDASSQLRYHVANVASDFAAAQVTPAKCGQLVAPSFTLDNLSWQSIAASSPDRNAAAQVFFAPSESAAIDALSQIRNIALSCTDISVKSAQVVTTVRVEPLSGPGDRALSFRQSVTREGKTQLLTVRYDVDRNALLALAVTDSHTPQLDTLLQDYTRDYFQRLQPLYTQT